jgi:nucleotide-binding universal stress UspA family protein
MTIMSNSSESGAPIIRTVLHPSDFSEGSLVAFAHALKVALISKSKLVLIHVSQSGKMDWANFPCGRLH